LALDDHKRQLLTGQLVGHRASDAAIGADHGVLVESADATVHALPPQYPSQLPGHHQLGHHAKTHKQRHHAGEDERDGEDLPLGVERLDFVEADRGQGDDGHVQGIQQAPALKDSVADYAVAGDRYQQQQRQAEPDKDPVPWRRPGNPEAASVKAAHAHRRVWSADRH